MAEVQRTTQSAGEMTQRFIEFIMMQAQQAALFLGRLPNPQTGKPEVHLDVARMLIDQLEMIREKTRGNLSSEETEILSGILADLQLAFVQASKGDAAAATPATSTEQPTAESMEQSAPENAPATDASAAPDDETESKKRFTKSYGS
jgi:hypothetical protein